MDSGWDKVVQCVYYETNVSFEIKLLWTSEYYIKCTMLTGNRGEQAAKILIICQYILWLTNPLFEDDSNLFGIHSIMMWIKEAIILVEIINQMFAWILRFFRLLNNLFQKRIVKLLKIYGCECCQ